MPNLGEILKLSGGGTYRWVLASMMRCVVGYSKWGKRCDREYLSEFVTESDEGFLVLTIENNYGRWVDEARWMVEHNGNVELDETVKSNFSNALYTNSGRSKINGRGSSKRYQGWSREGYLRFNELHKLVSKDRLTRANYELDLKKQFEKENSKTKNTAESDDEEEIFPANDLEGVIRCGSVKVIEGGEGGSGEEDSEEDEVDKENGEIGSEKDYDSE
jgi:hypothetical protein